MARFNLDCPHCKKTVYDREDGWLYRIDTPLRTCQYCSGEYIFPHIYEWSIAGPFYQFVYCFLLNGRWGFLLWIIGALVDTDWLHMFIVSLIWITFSIFRLKVFDGDNIKESYRRTKNNPEYIQKLSDLGYLYMDMRIDPYYK